MLGVCDGRGVGLASAVGANVFVLEGDTDGPEELGFPEGNILAVGVMVAIVGRVVGGRDGWELVGITVVGALDGEVLAVGVMVDIDGRGVGGRDGRELVGIAVLGALDGKVLGFAVAVGNVDGIFVFTVGKEVVGVAVGRVGLLVIRKVGAIDVGRADGDKLDGVDVGLSDGLKLGVAERMLVG